MGTLRTAALLACLATGTASFAVGQTRTATMTATIAVVARLTLTPAAISFPDANPDTVPQIAALPGPVTITAKARAPQGSAVNLTVLATDALRSGVVTIPATNVTWSTTGAGFVPGTLSASAAQPVGTWIGSGARTGTQSFLFANSWSLAVGTYSTTMIYTLSVP